MTGQLLAHQRSLMPLTRGDHMTHQAAEARAEGLLTEYKRLDLVARDGIDEAAELRDEVGTELADHLRQNPSLAVYSRLYRDALEQQQDRELER